MLHLESRNTIRRRDNEKIVKSDDRRITKKKTYTKNRRHVSGKFSSNRAIGYRKIFVAKFSKTIKTQRAQDNEAETKSPGTSTLSTKHL